MERAIQLAEKYKTILDKAEINTPLRLSAFMGEWAHESNLEPIQENLNYSAKRLAEIFPKYFPTPAIANVYAGHPKNIANRVYANRMGNGNEKSGDGWKYSGKGMAQITGKDNYEQLSKDTGIDYINHPEKLLNEADSMVSAIWFWSKNNLNKYADRQDYETLTKKINGGLINYKDRLKKINYYKTIFK